MDKKSSSVLLLMPFSRPDQSIKISSVHPKKLQTWVKSTFKDGGEVNPN